MNPDEDFLIVSFTKKGKGIFPEEVTMSKNEQEITQSPPVPTPVPVAPPAPISTPAYPAYVKTDIQRWIYAFETLNLMPHDFKGEPVSRMKYLKEMQARKFEQYQLPTVW